MFSVEKCKHPSKSVKERFDVNNEIKMPATCNDSTNTNSSEAFTHHVCQPNGQWKPRYVNPCKRRNRCACAEPPQYPKARLEILKRACPREGTKAIYECQSNMKGGGILVCRDGQWRGDPIQCHKQMKSGNNSGTGLQQSTCSLDELLLKVPPEISIVAANQSIYRTKKRLQLQCDKYNKIIGPKRVKCNHGKWEYTGKSKQQVPRCHKLN